MEGRFLGLGEAGPQVAQAKMGLVGSEAVDLRQLWGRDFWRGMGYKQRLGIGLQEYKGMGALALAVREDIAVEIAAPSAPPEPLHYVALRCAGGATLGLTRKLLDTGAAAWTPVVPQSRPVPRSRVRQWVMAPLLPTFVFLDSEALADAREARDRFLLPSFTPLALAGELVRIRSVALVALREIEAGLVEKSRRRAPPGRKLGVGTRVTLLSEAFTGLTAEVRASSRRSCVVDIGGMRMTVPSFLLKEVAL